MIFPSANYGSIDIHPNIVDALCVKPPYKKISYDQAVRVIAYSCMGCSLGYIDQELGMPLTGPLEHRFFLGNEAQELHQKRWLCVNLGKSTEASVSVYDFNDNKEVFKCATPLDVEHVLRKYKHPNRGDDCTTRGMRDYFYSALYKSRLNKGNRNGI